MELFAFLGSFVEEVVAPIPSPFVMTLAGSIAESQGHPFWYLFVVALIASTGKTIGATLLYWLSDKAEDIVLSRVGKFVGITHAEVEQFGQRFSGTWKDFVTLLVIRSTPIIPSAPISLICGFVAIRFKFFVVATFIGTIIRDFVYLYFGYTSLNAAYELMDGMEGIESIVQILLAVAGAVAVGWIIYKRKFSKQSAPSR